MVRPISLDQLLHGAVAERLIRGTASHVGSNKWCDLFRRHGFRAWLE
jgi:hypothetical protein